MAFGDDVVCTYVNTKEPEKAYLFVMKNTDPSGALDEFRLQCFGYRIGAGCQRM